MLLQQTAKPSTIDHLPGSYGLPILGNSLSVVMDLLGFMTRQYQNYGPISRMNVFFENAVAMAGPDANQFVLLNQNQVFSNQLGYEPYLGRMFPRGLMLRDFEEHRIHRRVMQVPFKKNNMEGYLERMQPIIQNLVAGWGKDKPFYYFPHIQQLTLNVSSSVFLGEEVGEESRRMGRAFEEVVAGMVALIRVPIPGLALGNGVRSRRILVEYFRSRIAARRAGNGSDLFTQMCQAKDDAGEMFSDQDIIDHMIFLLFAAHDTTTLGMTTMMYGLAKHPEWQDKIRAECLNVGDLNHVITYDDLDKMPITEWALKEALRMYPPVPLYLRRTVKECEFGGYHIPADKQVFISSYFTGRMEEWWTNPHTFDPGRFAPERAEHKRHAYSWIPFGGGAHMCIGMHFALMQVKAIVFNMLLRYRFSLENGYEAKYRQVPLPKPKDGLRLVLTPLN